MTYIQQQGSFADKVIDQERDHPSTTRNQTAVIYD